MKIPITKPYFDDRELELMAKPLATGWVVQGPYVKEFENRMAEFTGARFGRALNSCTSGQFLMSEIIGLKPGDEVIVPAFTWISTANAVEFLGARVVFCDVDLETFNIDVSAIEEKITYNTRALYPVHLFGLPANMTEIMRAANHYKLEVVEDCACGLGGRIGAKHCGTFGRGGIFSFHPRKSITTGEGGMIVTDDEIVAQKASALREHGAVKSDLDRHNEKTGFLLSQYKDLGYNMRMTDIQGALGVAQMEKLPRILEIKAQLAAEYGERLKVISWLRPPEIPHNYSHGYQAYCTLFKAEETLRAVKNKDLETIQRLHEQRNEIMARLEERGIATRQGTHAVHIQALYRDKYDLAPMDFPAAFAADRLTVALPFFPSITHEERDYLFAGLKEIDV